jgi:hypothetical protein
MPSLLLVKGEGCRHTFLQCVSPLLAKPAHRLTDVPRHCGNIKLNLSFHHIQFYAII